MGMHFGLLATRTTSDDLKNAFNDIWPDLEVVESAGGFQSADEFWEWMTEKAVFVSAADWTKENPGITTYAIWQDGEWTVLYDQSYVLASASDALSALSQRFGKTISFVVESAGGSAVFNCYDDGKQLRSIAFYDGDSKLEGDPLPEENGIDVGTYYMDETEALMNAFGLSLPEKFPRLDTTIALAVADRKDYGEFLSKAKGKAKKVWPENECQPEKKPWWKFWA